MTGGSGTGDVGRVLVCIPTYNEAENVEPIVARVRAAAPEVDVLVVDDSSPDGTGDIADRLAAADPSVHVLHRSGKEGLGAAYIAAFAWARERGYGVAVEMDADGSHQPEELPRLLAALRTSDVVLGSRWVPGGSVRNWPSSRRLLSQGGNTYTRVALGLPLRDATGGYRAYRMPVLDALPLGEVASQGYCFQVDLAWQAWRAGFRIVEVPITFVERERGQSKMSRAIVAEALWRVTWWAVRSRRARPARAHPASVHAPGSAQGPSAPRPSAQGPSANGPSAQGPSASGPSASGPSASGPSASGPSASGPTASGPSANGPSSQGPSSNRPSGPGGGG